MIHNNQLKDYFSHFTELFGYINHKWVNYTGGRSNLMEIKILLSNSILVMEIKIL
jgi:hypothetical protein